MSVEMALLAAVPARVVTQTNARRSHSCSRIAGACVATATSTLTFAGFADHSGSPNARPCSCSVRAKRCLC